VIVNLPRLIYEAKESEADLFRLLDEHLEMALRALEIKYRTLKQRCLDGLLPFLTRRVKGDQYFRLENSLRRISFAGLNEATRCFTGNFLHEDKKALKFAEEILYYFSDFVNKHSRKPEARSVLAMVSNRFAANRLAELDIERYGWANVNTNGTREQPYYTDMVIVPQESNVSWSERLKIEERFHVLAKGGHLTVLQLGDTQQDPEELLTTTRRLATTHNIGLYAFNRDLTYCKNCRKTFHGQLLKCPACGSADTLIRYKRVSAKYEPQP
jgi:ribonucleoside-triphosphate reductase